MDDIALKIWKEAACGDAHALLALAREYTGASLVLGDPILSVTAAACETDTDGWIWEDYIRAEYAPEFKHSKRFADEKRIWFSDKREGWLGRLPGCTFAHLLLDLHTAKGNRFHFCAAAKEAGQLEENLTFFDLLSEAVLVLLDRYETDANSRLPMELFLTKLLDGNPDEETMLQGRAQVVDFPLEGIFMILTVDLSNFTPKQDTIATIAEKLSKGVKSVSTVRGNSLVILQAYKKGEDVDDPAANEGLRRYLKQNGLTAARSRAFFIMRDVAYYYRQTERMLQLRTCILPDPLLEYPQLAMYLAIDRLPEEDKRENALHPSILKLLELDRESKFGYVETLKAYIACSQRAQLACQKLHIHRNTLDYRLKKIEDQIPVRWEDGDLIQQLYFSIQLLEYITASGK